MEVRIEDAADFFKTAWQKEQERLVALEQEEQEQAVTECRRCPEQQVHICAGDRVTENEPEDYDGQYIAGLEPY